jgi:hypothetical protein
MGTFTIRNTFDVDIDTFWSKVFFDPEYNRKLYEEGLKFGYELLEKKELDGGVVERRIRTEPRLEAPAVVKKLVGDSIQYEEKGRFDPKKRVWSFKITTSKMSDKIDISGEYWVEARGNKIERIVKTDIDVKIFGVGKAVAAFVEKSTRESYEKAARFTNTWLKEVGLATS